MHEVELCDWRHPRWLWGGGRRRDGGAAATVSIPTLLAAGRSVILKAAPNRIDLVKTPIHTVGMHGSAGGSWLSDKELVDAVLRDLAEAADRWEALVAEAETVTYSVDLGDIQAVADSDGKLVDLVLHSDVTARYTYGELAERMNIAFAALRAEVEGDYQARYGGELQ